ncbi:MAG: tRNA dihydrouridine synthase DusB [Parachlamydiaceae bacterium]
MKEFELGNVKLPSNIFYAPLAGCSDYPFRRMSAKYRPGLMYCEMVKMDAIVRNDANTYHLLDYDESMHPIGGQLCGSKPEIAGQAAKIIEDLGFDVIDLNCGCPVDKVTKDGSGSGMLKNPHLIGDVIANMVAAVNIPVTVKIRAGWDDQSIIAAKITQIAEEAGAKAICIHGRTREQAYKGPANWDHIKACKEAANKIKVIGNGDVFDAEAAMKMFSYTQCDAVLVSRGTLGQPWIAEDIYALQADQPLPERSLDHAKNELLEHFEETLSYHNERRTVIEMRRVGCWYLKKSAQTKSFRERISKAQNIQEVRELILSLEGLARNERS